MQLHYSKTKNQLWRCIMDNTGTFIHSCIENDELTVIDAREVYNCALPYAFEISIDKAIRIFTNKNNELAVLIPYDYASEEGTTWYSRTNFKYDVVEIYDDGSGMYSSRVILVTHSVKGSWKVKELISPDSMCFGPYCVTNTLGRGSSKTEALLASGLNMNTFNKKYPTYNAVEGNHGHRHTPNTVTKLNDGEIFVFGSNPAGKQNGGAAKYAKDYFGAIQGQGEGLQGQSYAIPTTQGVKELRKHVDKFIDFAIENPQYTFLVTKIGCGNAGLKVEDVAPLFRFALGHSNIVLPEEFVSILTK